MSAGQFDPDQYEIDQRQDWDAVALQGGRSALRHGRRCGNDAK